MHSTIISVLTDESLAQGVGYLVEHDPDLKSIWARLGSPPIWAREPGFSTLLHIILEQQVSLASARAAFDRLCAAVSPLTPSAFLKLDDVALKAIGFSRQKTRYGRLLAQAILDGDLDLTLLPTLPDPAVRIELTRLVGIGPWTAEIYLLMALRRPDAWPSGDLALAVAAQEIKGLPQRPDPATLNEMAQAWRPWRSVAARLLWHHYLSK